MLLGFCVYFRSRQSGLSVQGAMLDEIPSHIHTTDLPRREFWSVANDWVPRGMVKSFIPEDGKSTRLEKSCVTQSS